MTAPIQQGVINDLEAMQKIWDHLMENELRVNAAEHRVLMTETAKNPKKNRSDLCQVVFEEMGVNNFYLQKQAVLSLFASGKTTGTVVDCGYAISHTVPIYEGYALPHAIREFNIAGQDLTEYLKQQLMEKGFEYSSNNNMEEINKIKELHCHVVLDFDSEQK